MLDHNLTLKSDELYLVGNIDTDGSRERATGLYLRDTRHLSRFLVTINGARPERLQVRLDGAASATVISSNGLLVLEDGATLMPQKLMLEQRVELDDTLSFDFTLRNFSDQRVVLTLAFEICCDFRDLFDIRGYPRAARGEWITPQVSDRAIDFGYRGLDGLVAQTEVRFDRVAAVSAGAVDVLLDGPAPRLPSMSALVPLPALPGLPIVTVEFPVELEAGEVWTTSALVTPKPGSFPPVATRREASKDQAVAIVTGEPHIDRVLRRCLADLDALQTTFPDGSIPAAGIPWFVAPFGRDSLISGLQTLHLKPERAAGTLRVLAALQGQTFDPVREEEPGKILHEMRYGEMARLGEIPHTPYYGTVDATPLFVWLFAETANWTGDATLYAELKPNAVRALEWIGRFGDLDGDGLIEYRSDAAGTGKITNQVWKDSHDSLNHADGSSVLGPVAAVEVQGYLYAALDRLAGAAGSFGDLEWSTELRAKADRVRALVEELFWLDAFGFYAQALDGNKKPVTAMTSNPGHLLLAGLPARERADRVIVRMRQSDLDSGWGVRTLASDAVTYNPMSYHNGSVWPHDNSLIAAGFYRYGYDNDGHRVLRALLYAALTDPLFRLPELFCGFPRGRDLDDSPVRYPVSCSPQAWAAGAIPLLLRGMLGLQVDPVRRELTVDPHLPEWLPSVTINGLSVLGGRGSLKVTGSSDGYQVESDGLPLA